MFIIFCFYVAPRGQSCCSVAEYSGITVALILGAFSLIVLSILYVIAIIIRLKVVKELHERKKENFSEDSVFHVLAFSSYIADLASSLRP